MKVPEAGPVEHLVLSKTVKILRSSTAFWAIISLLDFVLSHDSGRESEVNDHVTLPYLNTIYLWSKRHYPYHFTIVSISKSCDDEGVGVDTLGPVVPTLHIGNPGHWVISLEVAVGLHSPLGVCAVFQGPRSSPPARKAPLKVFCFTQLWSAYYSRQGSHPIVQTKKKCTKTTTKMILLSFGTCNAFMLMDNMKSLDLKGE